MKKTWLKALAFVLASALVMPVTGKAQENKEKESKTTKEKSKDAQQIIITRKSGSDEKTVIEINGDKVTVNGKPLEEYRDKNGDLNVHLNKIKDLEFYTRIPNVSGTWNLNDNHQGFFSEETTGQCSV